MNGAVDEDVVNDVIRQAQPFTVNSQMARGVSAELANDDDDGDNDDGGDDSDGGGDDDDDDDM